MVVETKMYCTRGQYDSHYTTNVVYGLMIYLPVFYIFLKKLLHDRNISLRLKNLAEPQHLLLRCLHQAKRGIAHVY